MHHSQVVGAILVVEEVAGMGHQTRVTATKHRIRTAAMELHLPMLVMVDSLTEVCRAHAGCASALLI